MIVYSQVAQIGKLCYPDNRNHFTAHLVLCKVCFANPAFSAKSSKQKKKEGGDAFEGVLLDTERCILYSGHKKKQRDG